MLRALVLLLCIAVMSGCTKNSEEAQIQANQNEEPISGGKEPDENTGYNGVNPLPGIWYIGPFTEYCGLDTMFYPNSNGNYIEFKNNDTAYYTYITDNSSGVSPYKIIKANEFILNGDTLRIAFLSSQKAIFHSMDNERLRYTWELLK